MVGAPTRCHKWVEFVSVLVIAPGFFCWVHKNTESPGFNSTWTRDLRKSKLRLMWLPLSFFCVGIDNVSLNFFSKGNLPLPVGSIL